MEEMAQAQGNWFKKMVISRLGWLFVANECYREAFFRERCLSVMLGAGVPLNKVWGALPFAHTKLFE